uniref:Envelope fusion protein n=1 Tax=Trichogramma kaykai TaxID=54128 RepID=A0ABD2WQ40_9HYME
MALLNTLLALLVIHHVQGKYDVHPIVSNPGLYYEQQDIAYMRKATWRVIVHLNLEAFTEDHQLYTKYCQLMNKCRYELGEDFCEFFNNGGVGDKQREIDDLKRALKQAKTPTEETASRTDRKKRSAPLAIIGSLSHGLFGTATEDEIELIQRNLDQLFQDQKSIIKLNEEKTHILTHSISTLYKTIKNQGEIINLLYNTEQNFTKEFSKIQKAMKFAVWARRLEGKIDLQFNALREAQHALYKLGEGKIPHQFLNPQIIQNIAIEIQQSNTDLQEALPSTQIALSANPQQKQDNTTIGAAHIKPSHPYLLLSDDHKQYIKYDQLEMDQCTKGYHLLICPITTAIKESYLSSECEITLLLNPTQSALKQCNLMFNLEPSTQWYYLSHNSSWLYSIMNQETLEIMCPNEQDTSIKLKGVGILKITPGCQARTREFILQVEEIRKSSRTYIYNPELHLNVTELYPEIIKIKSLPNLPLPISGNWNNELTSVNELLDQMEKIGRHRREAKSTKTFVFSGLTIQLITIISLTGYIYYQYKSRSKKPTNSCPTNPKMSSSATSTQEVELSNTRNEGINNPSFHQTIHT